MSHQDADPLVVEDRGQIRWIWFNRPQVHNAQNVAMLERLTSTLEQTRESSSVRVVVLGGTGKSFCSGHDLREMLDNPEYAANASTAEGRFWQERRLFAEPVERFRELPVPTICRVQGHCLAAGLMFAASADLVVAGTDASFGSPIIPALAVNDAEVPAFAERVGERRAKALLWLGERMDAAEALRVGFANRVVETERLDAEVDQIAKRLLRAPREVLSLSKATFQFMADRKGERDVNRFHFMNHQFSHQTEEARERLRTRLLDGTDGSVVSDEHRLTE